MLGFSFSSVTGMLVDNGIGIFLSNRLVNIDSDINDVHEPEYAISFECLIKSGLEFGISHILDNETKPVNVKFNYHFNNKSLIGISMLDFADDYFIDTNFKTSIHTTYHDIDSFITLSYNLDAEKDHLTVEIGQLWQMNPMVLGLSYSANLSDINMGYVYLTVGSVF